jgi:hypothetical protein
MRNPCTNKAVAIPAVLLAAVIAGAPTVRACPGQAALSHPFSVAGGPFIGQWGAHGEGLTINADGTAVETYRGGSANIRFNAVQGPPSQPDTTAYGVITGGGMAEPGSYATATLVDSGRGLTLSVANGDNECPFCKMINDTKANSADCGA